MKCMACILGQHGMCQGQEVCDCDMKGLIRHPTFEEAQLLRAELAEEERIEESRRRHPSTGTDEPNTEK